MKLPDSKDQLGYTDKEIADLIAQYDIDYSEFWKTFGTNTVGERDGRIYYYHCDVENALNACLRRRSNESRPKGNL